MAMGLSMSLALRLEQRLKSSYKGALDLYKGSEKILVGVPMKNRDIYVHAALVSVEDLGSVFDGEKYAGTIGGMFFITRNTPEAPINCRTFAAFHELAEHAAPRGFDVTGLAKHFQALTLELGYAKSVLNENEYQEFLSWRKSVERTNFFQLDDKGLIERAKQRIEEFFDLMIPYLTYKRKKLVEVF